jgi:hypothetical protein
VSAWTILRRAVAIAGRVTDAQTGMPLAAALIEITAGPPAYQAALAALSSDPSWPRRPERLDRRLSRPDGMYAFSDLPVGSYALRVSAPQLGSRYGVAVLAAVRVWDTREPSGRVKLDPADAAIAPTRISGQVKAAASGQALAGAKVRLRGDTNIVLTGDDGRYALNGLVAGTPTVEVVAATFATFSQEVTLSAGQQQTVNVALIAA